LGSVTSESVGVFRHFGVLYKTCHLFFYCIKVLHFLRCVFWAHKKSGNFERLKVTHLGSLTAANWVSVDYNVFYSSCWGYSLINTFKVKKKKVTRFWWNPSMTLLHPKITVVGIKDFRKLFYLSFSTNIQNPVPKINFSRSSAQDHAVLILLPTIQNDGNVLYHQGTSTKVHIRGIST